eukprot:sb/3477071/
MREVRAHSTWTLEAPSPGRHLHTEPPHSLHWWGERCNIYICGRNRPNQVNNQSELVSKVTLTGYQPIRDQYFLIRSVPGLWLKLYKAVLLANRQSYRRSVLEIYPYIFGTN